MTIKEEIDAQVKYGFELALRYARMADQHEMNIIEMLEEQLDSWGEEVK